MLLHKARALEALRRCGLEAVIANTPTHVTYLTDYRYWLDGVQRVYMNRPGASSEFALQNYAVLTAEGQGALIVPPLHMPEADVSWVGNVRTFGKPALDFSLFPADLPDQARPWLQRMTGPLSASPVEALIGVLRDLGLGQARLGLELEGLTPGVREALAAALPHVTFLDCSNLLRLIRAVKSPEEIARLTQAAGIGERAASACLSQALPGRSLAHLAQAYRTAVGQQGADFDHLIFGVHGLGVGTDTDYCLRAGDVLLLDYGCRYKHYVSDSGQTLVVGEMSAPLAERYAYLYEAVQVGAAQLRPGIRASHVHGAMLASLAGHGITTCHAHGHGFGLDVRDYPIIVDDTGLRLRDDCIDIPADLELEPDMVVNLEAPLYLAGAASLHLEQTFRLTPQGAEPLLTQPRERPFQFRLGAQ